MALNFRNMLALAPMEDVTEPPFRFICKKLGADLLYTEFISSEGLIRDAKKAQAKLFFYKEERPLAIQIFGGNADSMKTAAQIAESANPDFIDINCGCWVRDVAIRGQGAGLLKDLPAMSAIIESVVKSVSLPVSVKTRLGWDEKNIVILEVAKMCESLGVAALTVHCRTRGDANKGEANWDWIKKIKDIGVTIPIILTGNVKTPSDVENAFTNFGADSVMIGQAAINNPWIFRQSKFYIENGFDEDSPAIEEKIDLCIEHLRLAVELKGERKGVIEFRKHYSGYLHSLPDISKFRLELMQYDTSEPIIEKLNNYKTI